MGRCQGVWLTKSLGLAHGTPSHDTFGSVFDRVDPASFALGFRREVQGSLIPQAGAVVAIDGKTMCWSGYACQLNAATSGQCLGQWPAPRAAAGGSRDEVQPNCRYPHLPLEHLVLTDQIATIDLLGCQRTIAARIVDQSRNYTVALKENQPDVLDVSDSFAVAAKVKGTDRKVEKDHGRRETRRCKTIADPAVLAWLDPDQHRTGWRCIALVTAIWQDGVQDATMTT